MQKENLPGYPWELPAVKELLKAQADMANAERRVREAVWACRDAGVSWSFIGGYFGVSKQAAQQRFGGK